MDKDKLAKLLVPTPPKKLLALDGGGIRGLITLEVLAKMECLLAGATRKGSDFRLCDFFDYIGGTSTGAIIAAGLARGMSTSDLLNFYRDTGPSMFQRPFILKRIFNLYKAEPLANKLKEKFGADTNLMPEHLRCLLLIVTRNKSTDSFWPISSNTQAKYNALKNKDGTDNKQCNLKLPLWQLVRASTAAPIFFEPEVIQLDQDNPAKRFVFVDGGTTPYNNPAFLLFRMATDPAYNLNWKTGEQNLLLISVGTGAAPELDAEVYATSKNALSNLADFAKALMYGAQVDQDINCRTLGRCVYGDKIDRELGDMIPKVKNGDKEETIPISQDQRRAFLYARYNVDLSEDGLKQKGLGDLDPKKVGALDAVDSLNDLSRIGKRLAEEVKLEHFGSFV